MHVGAVLAVSPSSYCLTCFTICVVKFLDFPPRLGFVRHATEKPRSFDQQAETDECCKTSRISLESKLAAAGRAPFGILFRIPALRRGWLIATFCDVDVESAADLTPVAV